MQFNANNLVFLSALLNPVLAAANPQVSAPSSVVSLISAAETNLGSLTTAFAGLTSEFAALTTDPALRSELDYLTSLYASDPAAASSAAIAFGSGYVSLLRPASTTGDAAAAGTAPAGSSSTGSNPAAQATAMPVLGMGAAVLGLVGAVAAL